ncbi:MAG: hypothetical protein QM710_14755 [Flavobacterium sp.]
MTEARDGKKWMRRCEIGSWAGTIGIDGCGDGVIATCPQHLQDWFNNSNIAALAAHYMHEYMHHLGFRHDGRKSKSLVYMVGNIVENLIKN